MLVLPSSAAAASSLVALLALSEPPTAFTRCSPDGHSHRLARHSIGRRAIAGRVHRRACRRCQVQVWSSPADDDEYGHAPPRPFAGGLGGRNLHPIVTSALLRASRDNPRRFGLDDLSRSLDGLHIWGEALRKGRLPTEEEFHNITIWPERPLYDELVRILIELELPRFVLRHPETADAVLLSLLLLRQLQLLT